MHVDDSHLPTDVHLLLLALVLLPDLPLLRLHQLQLLYVEILQPARDQIFRLIQPRPFKVEQINAEDRSIDTVIDM